MRDRDDGIGFAQVVEFSAVEIKGPEKGILSRRELEVLFHAGRGLTNDEIGLGLGIARGTVNNHFSSISAKLHVKHRHYAVIKGIEAGLFDLQDLVSAETNLSGISRLTDREKELLGIFVVNDFANKQAADLLKISERTVKNHITSILTKTGAANRTQAVVYFLEAERRKAAEREIVPLGLIDGDGEILFQSE